MRDIEIVNEMEEIFKITRSRGKSCRDLLVKGLVDEATKLETKTRPYYEKLYELSKEMEKLIEEEEKKEELEREKNNGKKL